MLFRLLLLFVLVPVLELLLLIRLGRWIGLWPTLGIIVVTGVIGSILARQQGFSVLARLQERLGRGELPGSEIVDGAIILVSGALLLTPGVATDVVGFLGLIPWTRRAIRRGLTGYLRKKVREGSANLQIFWSGPGPGRSGPGGPGGSGGTSGGSGGAGSGPSRSEPGESEPTEEGSYEIIEEDAEEES